MLRLLMLLLAGLLITGLTALGCQELGLREPSLPDDPEIAAFIEANGGVQGYCQAVRDDAPTKESYEVLAEAFGGLAILFGGNELSPGETIALIQWTADACY